MAQHDSDTVRIANAAAAAAKYFFKSAGNLAFEFVLPATPACGGPRTRTTTWCCDGREPSNCC